MEPANLPEDAGLLRSVAGLLVGDGTGRRQLVADVLRRQSTHLADEPGPRRKCRALLTRQCRRCIQAIGEVATLDARDVSEDRRLVGKVLVEVVGTHLADDIANLLGQVVGMPGASIIGAAELPADLVAEVVRRVLDDTLKAGVNGIEQGPIVAFRADLVRARGDASGILADSARRLPHEGLKLRA